MADRQTFGAWLRAQRAARDLTQRELAAVIGCSAVMIRRLETHARRPSKAMLERILRVLEVPAEQRGQVAGLARPSAADAADRCLPGKQTGQLPTSITPLIGRERAVEDLVDLLCRRPSRLITLTGPAGVGKTRLAQAVARALRAAFADGVWWVALGELTDPTFVADQIQSVLDTPRDAAIPALEVLIKALHDRQILLVLDNFEHVLAAAGVVAQLLEATEQLTVLVTSRERLRVYGERLYPVPPLALPPADARQNWRVLAASPAAQLLYERIQAIHPTFEVSAADAASIARLCHVLEGNPLALELAAAQTRWLPLRQIHARLDELLPTMSEPLINRPERQSSLWSALEWSYTLLPPPLQALLVRMSVFHGGCTLEAAQAVIASTADVATLTTQCRALAEKHLIQWLPDESRYAMTFVVREYARAHLHQSQAYAAVAAQHAAYYCALAESARAEIEGARRAEVVEQLSRDYPNLRAALQWSSRHQPAIAARLCHALGLYWSDQGYRQEGLRWTRAVYEQRQHLSTADQAALLLWQGILAPVAEQPALLAQSLALYQTLGDADHGAQTLTALGGRAYNRGDYAAAQHYWERALEFWRSVGATRRMIFALNNLGAAAGCQGDYAAARRYLEEALHYQRQIAPEQTGFVLGNLGAISYYLGEHASAQELLEEAIPALQRERRDLMMARAQYYLALLARSRGDMQQAWSNLRASATMIFSLEYVAHLPMVLEAAADLYLAARHIERAMMLLGAADAMRTREQSPLLPIERPAYDQLIAALRQAVDPLQFAMLWQHGTQLDPRATLALVLSPDG